VKDAFRDGAKRGEFQVLTKKPVVAGEDEERRNPRSRSAKMRAAEKVLQQAGKWKSATR
jgi:16S rRNA (cytosine1402-N4)-methyltransferase